MLTILRSNGLLLSIGFALLTVTASGCASTTEEDAASSEEAVVQGLHEPKGSERAAIFDAFREVLKVDLQGQEVAFNSTDPVGRFVAHDDWASYEGILEGPNGNARPINYSKSVYKDASEGGWLEGVQRNGHFAARFNAMAHRGADGKWHVAALGSFKTYAVGGYEDVWLDWAAVPPLAKRDVSLEFPKDDLHEPVGAERKAILNALHAAVDPTLAGQVPAFNSKDPPGTFLTHDGWAFYSGVIEGPNGNKTPIDYSRTVYREKSGKPGFEGVLRNGHFAARLTALLQQNKDGSWKVSAQTLEDDSGVVKLKGFEIGTSRTYFGEISSSFAYDIYGDGDGNDGDGDGGDGE